MNASDAEIVERCLSGEEEAFRILVQRYERPVYGLIHRMVASDDDARDLTQESFVKVFRSLDQFDPTRNFSSWIFKIASNQTIDYLRKRRVQTISIHADPENDDRPEIQLEDSAPGPSGEYAETRRRERLGELVQRLPAHYRVAVELRYSQQRSYEEIAETLDLPLGTVKARLHRAHHQLRAWMEGTDLEEGGR
ncbi:MAG: sigma-70 family RNA polymerase sigma factor [Candidatus Eisenbacteria bacterium]|uniref:Sigma-70 family RNA polymerase sigma factor n=1 Tax=Eiseniibacteriota bacterium TaxID=2212470 RepID=A0A956LXG7_UNCEI|nr:sigma-70 family RNA polymerase sigma factor [Candidatus Eisenbacteria bacterium]